MSVIGHVQQEIAPHDAQADHADFRLLDWFAEIGGIVLHLHSFARASRVVRGCLFMGFIFPNLPLRLPPVLNCSTVLAASLLVQFIGTLGDLRGQIDRFLGHGVQEPRHLIITTFTASFTTRHETMA